MATAEGTREREIKRKVEKERKSFTTRLIAQRGTESLFASWQLEVSRVRTRWLRGSLVPVATCPRVPVSRQSVCLPRVHTLSIYLSSSLSLSPFFETSLEASPPPSQLLAFTSSLHPPHDRHIYMCMYVCFYMYIYTRYYFTTPNLEDFAYTCPIEILFFPFSHGISFAGTKRVRNVGVVCAKCSLLRSVLFSVVGTFSMFLLNFFFCFLSRIPGCSLAKKSLCFFFWLRHFCHLE